MIVNSIFSVSAIDPIHRKKIKFRPMSEIFEIMMEKDKNGIFNIYNLLSMKGEERAGILLIYQNNTKNLTDTSIQVAD